MDEIVTSVSVTIKSSWLQHLKSFEKQRGLEEICKEHDVSVKPQEKDSCLYLTGKLSSIEKIRKIIIRESKTNKELEKEKDLVPKDQHHEEIEMQKLDPNPKQEKRIRKLLTSKDKPEKIVHEAFNNESLNAEYSSANFSPQLNVSNHETLNLEQKPVQIAVQANIYPNLKDLVFPITQHVSDHQGQDMNHYQSSDYTNAMMTPSTNSSHGNFHSHSTMQFIIDADDDDILRFESNRKHNKLSVTVHQSDIASQKTAIIATSANSNLTEHGNISRTVLNAAGPRVMRECQNITYIWKSIQPGSVISTGSGYLAPDVETILHAVLPSSKDHPEARQNLFQCFDGCLRLSVPRQKSLSIPAIGSEIFGLSKVVSIFYAALQKCDLECSVDIPTFDSVDIHFVSNDIHKVKEIRDTLRQNILTQKAGHAC